MRLLVVTCEVFIVSTCLSPQHPFNPHPIVILLSFVSRLYHLQMFNFSHKPSHNANIFDNVCLKVVLFLK